MRKHDGLRKKSSHTRFSRATALEKEEEEDGCRIPASLLAFLLDRQAETPVVAGEHPILRYPSTVFGAVV